MNRSEQKMREYELANAQALHWLSHVWRSNQFFVAVESVFLAGTVYQLLEWTAATRAFNPTTLAVFIIIILFNIVLCRIWNRTHRRNFEYLDSRFQFAIEIESDPDLSELFHLYTEGKKRLRGANHKRRSSRKYELFIPNLFLVAWLMLFVISLCIAVFDSTTTTNGPTTGSAVP